MRLGVATLISISACNSGARRVEPQSAGETRDARTEVAVPTEGDASMKPSSMEGAASSNQDAMTDRDAEKSATSRVTSRDGSVTLSGRDGHARHTHGGPPARLGTARFVVDNRSSRTRKLRAKAVEALVSGQCAPPSKVSSRPALAHLAVADSAPRSGAGSNEVELAAGSTRELTVYFAPVEAYMAWCDRFAFRVSFELDDEELVAVAETMVTRVEPLRR